MEVHLDRTLHEKLSRLADAGGSDVEVLAREAIERFLDYDGWFLGAVDKGLGQIEAGETLSHAEVGIRLKSC